MGDRLSIVRRLPPVSPALAAALLMLGLPWLGADANLQRQAILIAIFAIMVVGLNLSYGYAGELSLGQAAVFAAGAYTCGILAVNHHNDLLITMPAAVAIAAAVGLISGIPGLRLGGWSLAMVSFFLILLVPDVVNILQRWTGGFAGLSPIPIPRFLGRELDTTGYYTAVMLTAIAVVGFMRNLVTSRHGAALRVLKQSPILASSLGIGVYRTKLLAYVLGALPAGAAGCLFAYLDGFIAPDSFSFSVTTGLLAASILGGSESVYGAIVGAALLQLGPLRSSAFHQYALIVYGAFLVIGGIFLSGGLTGIALRFLPRLRVLVAVRPAEVGNALRRPLEVRGETLVVSDVRKSFGGLLAVDRISMRAEPGRVTAVIGANGSGKTTLLNLISGFYRPDAGEVTLSGERLTGLPPHRIASLGVGRTFQTPAIPAGLTALEVVACARYAKDYVGVVPAVLRLPKYRQTRRHDITQAAQLLGLLGLSKLTSAPASSLPLGTRRLLEVARALAGEPGLLLLDEPASGLDHNEVREFSEAVRQVRNAGGTVVLVEHNFPLVLELADWIYVLRRGQLIAEGPPGEIRSNALVIESYLGAA